MASATGIPQTNPSSMDRIGEDEPLLGRAGDASQQQGKPLPWNLVLGTGTVAQAGIWIVCYDPVQYSCVQREGSHPQD